MARISQGQALDLVLHYFASVPVASAATPTPTAVPTATPTATPPSPHDKLRCFRRGNGTVEGRYSLKQGVATHMEATFVNPGGDYWEYGFRVHSGRVKASVYPEEVGPSGFMLVVSSEGEVVLKGVSGRAAPRILFTVYLSDLGVPFNTERGQRNHLTLLSRNENELYFRFFVNGVKVDEMESSPHSLGGYKGSKDGRDYARYHAHWEHFIFAESQAEVEGVCINNAWVRLD